MKAAGHTDRNTQAKHYQPRNGADAQDAFHGGSGRALLLELSRELTVAHVPNMWQCLPAEKQLELDNSDEMLTLRREIAELEGKETKTSKNRQQALLRRKAKIGKDTLRQWQKTQPRRYTNQRGYHRSIFDRVRYLMPERDRLAKNLFEVDSLRSRAPTS